MSEARLPSATPGAAPWRAGVAGVHNDTANFTPGVITVYGDLACPFAGLTVAGLRDARERLGRTDVRLDIRALPLELVNRRPHDFGLVEMEKAVLAHLDPRLGWRRWRGRDVEWPVTTLLALEAVQAAKRPEVGGLPASEELDWALRRALFVDSRCVALLPVILEVAEECGGMDRAALATALQAGAARAEVFAQLARHEAGAVHGSPHVFTAEGQDWVNPGLALEHAGDYVVVTNHNPEAYAAIVRAA